MIISVIIFEILDSHKNDDINLVIYHFDLFSQCRGMSLYIYILFFIIFFQLRLYQQNAEKKTSLELKTSLSPAFSSYGHASYYASQLPIERKRRFFKKIGKFFKKVGKKIWGGIKKLNPIEAIKRKAKEFIKGRIVRVLLLVNKYLNMAIKKAITKVRNYRG